VRPDRGAAELEGQRTGAPARARQQEQRDGQKL